jgi:hypothetical protein
VDDVIGATPITIATIVSLAIPLPGT